MWEERLGGGPVSPRRRRCCQGGVVRTMEIKSRKHACIHTVKKKLIQSTYEGKNPHTYSASALHLGPQPPDAVCNRETDPRSLPPAITFTQKKNSPRPSRHLSHLRPRRQVQSAERQHPPHWPKSRTKSVTLPRSRRQRHAQHRVPPRAEEPRPRHPHVPLERPHPHAAAGPHGLPLGRQHGRAHLGGRDEKSYLPSRHVDVARHFGDHRGAAAAAATRLA